MGFEGCHAEQAGLPGSEGDGSDGSRREGGGKAGWVGREAVGGDPSPDGEPGGRFCALLMFPQ